jgi:hypothetical protein
LVASHRDQNHIVLAVGGKLLGGANRSGRSTPAHHVFERQAVAADISEALTPREHGDKLAAFLKSGRVQRSDYARPKTRIFTERLAPSRIGSR